MAIFVGPGSASDGGFEGRNDRVGIPTATSDPGSAVLGDMYYHTVGSGTTLKIYNGSDFDAVTITQPVSATGGTKTTSGNKTIHSFTSPGNFVVSNGGPVNYLLIAGGGGAGFDVGGAGGAGGLHYKESHPVTAQTYPVTIGGGGAPGPGQSQRGSSGGDSSAFGITAGGGAGGGSYQAAGPGNDGRPAGGSGGGAGQNGASGGSSPGSNSHPGGTDVESPPAGWGGSGGDSNPSPWSSAAGGGSGGDATNPPGPNQMHNASNHTTYTISGSPVNYAGGGYGNSDGGSVYQTGRDKDNNPIGGPSPRGFGANATGAPNTNPYPGSPGILIISYET